jgi:hypothetical protein
LVIKVISFKISAVHRQPNGGRTRSPGIWPRSLPKKYTFTSITRVPVVQIERLKAYLKGLNARIVMSSSDSMVTYTCGLLPNSAKVPNFQCKAMVLYIVLEFHNDGENFKNHNFEPLCYIGHDPRKVPTFQNRAKSFVV